MTPEAEPFGVLPDGRTVERWTLRNAHGLVVRFISHGGAITDILQPGRDGAMANVVLAHPDLAGYVGRPGEDRPYFGALIGRYANRIAGARFVLNGTEHRLSANQGVNTLHGGTDGFDQQLWSVEPGPPGAASATLRHISPAGSNGFPGTLSVAVTYTLTDADELHIRYAARTDADTPVSLTNHSYFNLGGDASGSIDRHRITIAADAFLPVDAGLIPRGPSEPVDGTPFDLRRATMIGDALARPHPQLLLARGFDHCWLLRPGLHLAALVHDPASGRWLRCSTDMPALQFYTGNFLNGALPGRSGAAYRQGAGFALETQYAPDGPNRPDLPSCILPAGQERAWTTVFAFGCSEPGS